MNVERQRSCSRAGRVGSVLALVAILTMEAGAVSSREFIREGNTLYAQGKYAEAINKYNDALVERPESAEPKFNKAGSYYRMDDLGEALDLYQEVATKSKDMILVAKAKYNTGNCFFQRGATQRDSDLQKAVEDIKTSIAYWRQVLEIDPKNEKAARNIEVARLTIKDILDQIKRQQEQQKQDPNQPQQQNQQQQDPNQPQDPNQMGNSDQSRDPNQRNDPNQSKDGEQSQDPNQTKDQQQQARNQPQDRVEQDAAAQEIIDTEQRQKKEREVRHQGGYQRVERDW